MSPDTVTALAAPSGHEHFGMVLASVNAGLNSLSAVLLGLGFWFIRRRQIAAHRACMMSAFVVSGLFLACYLTRFALTGTHRFPGDGLARIVYLAVLSTHMLMAAVTPVLAIRAIWLAYGKRFAEHKLLVRYAWPIWMYVSVTGVIVYAMLYHWPQ